MDDSEKLQAAQLAILDILSESDGEEVSDDAYEKAQKVIESLKSPESPEVK